MKGERTGRMKEALGRAAKAFLSALYPEGITCDVCGAELVADTRYTLCADCLKRMPFITGHRCLVCGVPIKDEADYCLRCQRTESAFSKNISPLRYDGDARKLVYSLKFGKKKYIAAVLGAMMWDEYIRSGEACGVVEHGPIR